MHARPKLGRLIVIGGLQRLEVFARDQPRDGQHHLVYPLGCIRVVHGLLPIGRAVVIGRPPLPERPSSLAITGSFLRPPPDGISDPAVDIGFPPAGTVDADPNLRGEHALGDLAVEGGAGKPGPRKDGLQADDTVWCRPA